MEFLSYLISGISLGSIYAIIALGYTMVYGIAKMLNFAHGDVIMVGGYISFCAVSYLGLPGWLALILAMVVCTVLGIVIEGLAYKPLRSAPSLAVLITAIGVSYFLQNTALLIWKAAPKVYPSLIPTTSAEGESNALQLFNGQVFSLFIGIRLLISIHLPGKIAGLRRSDRTGGSNRFCLQGGFLLLQFGNTRRKIRDGTRENLLFVQGV